MDKKYNVLFIKGENTKLDTDTKVFTEVFDTVEKATDTNKALKLIHSKKYDVVIHDATIDHLNGVTFVQQIKKMKPEQEIVALVSLENENKLEVIIDLGVNVYIITPEEFDPALEAIASMNLKS